MTDCQVVDDGDGVGNRSVEVPIDKCRIKYVLLRQENINEI